MSSGQLPGLLTRESAGLPADLLSPWPSPIFIFSYPRRYWEESQIAFSFVVLNSVFSWENPDLPQCGGNGEGGSGPSSAPLSTSLYNDGNPCYLSFAVVLRIK